MMPLDKILLVDDDRATNFYNRIMLKDNNIDCAVLEALDGQEALTHIGNGERCPDVILLDINMPGIDGFEFLNQLEQGGKCCDHVSVYMLTSSTRDEDKSAALSHHSVKGFFEKPLSDTHLAEILAGV